MAATVNSKITLLLSSLFQNTVGVAAAQANIDRSLQIPLPSGVLINQADKVYSSTITIAASGSTTLDLAGSLLDALGVVITFARIKVIMISALVANVNNVVMGAAAGTVFRGPLGSDTDTLSVRPGGLELHVAPDATAWAVGAGATDFLKFANSGAGTGVTFDLVLIGASA